MLVVIFNVGVDTADEVAHGRKGSAPDGHPYLTVITLVPQKIDDQKGTVAVALGVK